jgi:hypothetical protein
VIEATKPRRFLTPSLCECAHATVPPQIWRRDLRSSLCLRMDFGALSRPDGSDADTEAQLFGSRLTFAAKESALGNPKMKLAGILPSRSLRSFPSSLRWEGLPLIFGFRSKFEVKIEKHCLTPSLTLSCCSCAHSRPTGRAVTRVKTHTSIALVLSVHLSITRNSQSGGRPTRRLTHQRDRRSHPFLKLSQTSGSGGWS